MSTYEWGLVHGAERVLAQIMYECGNSRNATWILDGIRRQISGIRLLKEVLAELEEVRAASNPQWPRMINHDT